MRPALPRRFPCGILLSALAVLACEPQTAERSGDIGTVDFETSCSESVGPAFNHAVSLLHHMTYPQAAREFEQISAADSTCAMAHWGVAMTLFQPLWPTRPGPREMEAGRAHVQKALALAAPTAREQMYIAMAAAFFDPAAGDYWTRIARWESAARELALAFPDDHDAAAFYALAHLATAPPSGGTPHQDSAARILAGILEDSPEHPGAVHYMIHANDADGREHEAPDIPARYAGIAPRNPHALHMPTHIFVRLGDWPAVIAGNTEAAAAALEHTTGDSAQWVWDEFPHALEYLVYAALQRGDDSTAYHAMLRLQNTAKLQPSFKTAFHSASIPARYALERHAWEEAANLRVRPVDGLAWDRFPWPDAITWYARGLGAVHNGDIAAAAAAERRLGELARAAADAGEDLFARHIEILRLQVAASLAHAGGRDSEAIAQMQEAVRLEAQTPKHPVTPAPTLPASEVLGDLLMELDRPHEAFEAYVNALQSEPGRFNSLAGAARAAALAGDSATAATYYTRLRNTAAEGSPRSAVRDARNRTSP